MHHCLRVSLVCYAADILLILNSECSSLFMADLMIWSQFWPSSNSIVVWACLFTFCGNPAPVPKQDWLKLAITLPFFDNMNTSDCCQLLKAYRSCTLDAKCFWYLQILHSKSSNSIQTKWRQHSWRLVFISPDGHSWFFSRISMSFLLQRSFNIVWSSYQI